MKNKRFASYLLSGKVAAMPFFSNNSFADATPSYQELLSENLSIIETPAEGVRLITTTTTPSSYGGADAALCSTELPSTMNVVVTGVKPGDTVYLVASTNKDEGEFDFLSNQIRVGLENFTMVSSFTSDGKVYEEEAGDFEQSIRPISIPVDVTKLEENGLLESDKFYLQAVIYPSSGSELLLDQGRFSELDEIQVSTEGCPSTYGDSTY